MCMNSLLVPVLVLVGFVCPYTVLSAGTDYKCCTPDQWEGDISVDLNQIAFFLRMNASARVAYDYTNSIAFLNVTGVMKSPEYGPEPQIVSVLYVEDYKNEVEYEVDNDTECQKAYMPGFVMTKQCIKSDDKLLYSGMVGNGLMTETYNISLNDDFDNVRATIQRDTCLPVHLAYISSDYGSITDVNVFNITPGIKDRKIFEKPSQCKNVTKIAQHPFKSIVKELFMKRMLYGHT